MSWPEETLRATSRKVRGGGGGEARAKETETQAIAMYSMLILGLCHYLSVRIDHEDGN